MPKYADKAFTTYSNGLLRVLTNEVGIVAAGSDIKNARTYTAVWDTGATATAITKRVVQECGLKPTGMTQLVGVNSSGLVPTYLVRVALPCDVNIDNVRVAEGDLAGDEDVLIGMDIIGIGDFAVSTHDGRTSFSFRYPSLERIDFLPPKDRLKAFHPKARPSVVFRNAPCPCGSGKKYKRCCGP